MALIETHGAWSLAFVALAYFLGGFIKGLVGFALPLIAVAASASVLDKSSAVALIILPVLVSNLAQALRSGVGPLLATARRFAGLNIMLGAMIFVGAAALPGLDDRVFFVVVGVATLSATLIQIVGWRPRISAQRETAAGFVVGGVAGFIGGLSGIWGPPIVLFLNALETAKADHMRASGLAFLIGSIILLPAHLSTGVLDMDTLPVSAALIVPTLAGMALGRAAEGRLDAKAFRTATLIVLSLAALNLLRRAVFGA